MLIFYLFIRYIRPEYENFNGYTSDIRAEVTFCYILFATTIVTNLILSVQQAGPIKQPPLKSDTNKELKGLSRDEKIAHELMQNL